MKKWMILLVAILVVGLGGYFIINSLLNEEPVVVESPTGTPTEEASNEAGKTQPTAGLEEGSKEEEISPSLVPSEAASPSSIPSPTELPTPTVTPTNTPTPTVTATPTPLPTSTPTPSPIPLPTQIPVEEMSFVYEIQRGDNVWYRFTEDTLYVTGSGKVDEWKNCHNYNLDTELHINLENTKKIVIEEGITEIGDWAFYGALVAKELYLPKTLTYIGEYAFYMFGISCESYSADVYGLDKDRITIATCAFGMSSIGDEELTVLPTPTPTPSPIPVPKAEDVDPNNPKMIARVQMGDNVYFEFYDNYEMHVVGSGKTWDMPLGFDWERNYARDKYPHIPVFEKEYVESITVCYVEDDVTYLGAFVFGGLFEIDEVSVPSTIEKGDCGISIRNFHFREE